LTRPQARIVSNLDVATNSSLLAAAQPEDNPNEIHEDNPLLTEALLGITNAPSGSEAAADSSGASSERDKLISWLKGGESRRTSILWYQ